MQLVKSAIKFHEKNPALPDLSPVVLEILSFFVKLKAYTVVENHPLVMFQFDTTPELRLFAFSVVSFAVFLSSRVFQERNVGVCLYCGDGKGFGIWYHR